MNKKFLIIFSFCILAGLVYFFIYKSKGNLELQNNSLAESQSSTTSQVSTETASSSNQLTEEYSDAKTFVFDDFHGSTSISDKFKFLYPVNWHNNGQYFSPEKIEYYSLYNVKAPVFFDLIRADIFNDTELKYQIDKSRRKSPDSIGKIDGKDFKKYDLIDYGSYGGESAGRVIIYVGPKINIDGREYFLVFHWEEKPLTVVISGNDPEIFERMVLSLKFIQ